MNLDDLNKIAEVDRSNMRRLLKEFPDQLAQAWECSLELPSFEKLVICGMGGSAIGGDVLRVYLAHTGFPKPVTVVRGYELPPFADEKTLVIAVSYSGNTEETLSCTSQALERSYPFAALTSGGKLAHLAVEHRAPVIEIPGGLPPRTALGHLLMPLLRSFAPLLDAGQIKSEFRETLERLRALAPRYADAPESENPAKGLAHAWQSRIPVIYGGAPLTEAVARRWKTQINENAKQPAFWGVLSELHHNEIMSWEDRDLQQPLTYAFLRDPEEHPQIAKRFEISRDLLEERGQTALEYRGEGEGFLARMMGLIYLGDWASFYLAVLNGVDPTPVELIEELKRRLARPS